MVSLKRKTLPSRGANPVAALLLAQGVRSHGGKDSEEEHPRGDSKREGELDAAWRLTQSQTKEGHSLGSDRDRRDQAEAPDSEADPDSPEELQGIRARVDSESPHDPETQRCTCQKNYPASGGISQPRGNDGKPDRCMGRDPARNGADKIKKP